MIETWLEELRDFNGLEIASDDLSLESRDLLRRLMVRAGPSDEFRQELKDAIKLINRADARPIVIRRGFLDWFRTRRFDARGRLLETSWSRPRTLSALLSFALVLYAFAPFYAPFVPALKSAMKDFAWILAELKWAILTGALGLEAVRALKGPGFGAPLGPIIAPHSGPGATGGPTK